MQTRSLAPLDALALHLFALSQQTGFDLRSPSACRAALRRHGRPGAMRPPASRNGGRAMMKAEGLRDALAMARQEAESIASATT